MLTQARISIGSSSVGMTSVDSTRIRGEGGLLAPFLVIPLQVTLNQRPKEERLALLRLQVVLWITGPQASAQLSLPYVAFGDGGGGAVWHTYETHNFETTVELRFPLSAEQLHLVEATAHQMQTPNLGFALVISPAFAVVRDVEQLNTVGVPGHVHMLSHAFDLRPLAWPTAERLELQVSRDEWVTIGRRLGLDELRLVALRLPKQVPGLDPKLVARFDEALLKYEARDYRGAIQLCRDIRELVEQSLGASRANPVSAIVAAERGLSSSAPPIEFLDGAWKVLIDTTNAAHHGGSVGVYTAPDARAVLLLTAVLLEYGADALRRTL